MSTPNTSREDIDLFGLVSVILNNKLLIILSAVLGFALMAAAGYWMTPIYRAEVTMLPADQESEADSLSTLAGQFGGLASLAGINLSNDNSKEEAMATLVSRTFSVQFIRDQDLMPVLFQKLWDEQNQTWTPEDVAEHPTEWDAYKKFNERIRFVDEETRTGVVVLAVEWRNREQAAEWANALADRVNLQLRNSAIREAETSIDYLERELAKTSIVELQQGIYRLIENHINKIMLANVRDEYAFKIIDRAVVPDVDAFVRPKRFIMMCLGILIGGFFGVGLAVMRSQKV